LKLFVTKKAEREKSEGLRIALENAEEKLRITINELAERTAVVAREKHHLEARSQDPPLTRV
jgi:hypothetical protein